MKKILLFLACSCFLLSCSPEETTMNETTYNMIKVSGGFAGVDESYNKGEITWTLNADSSTLLVVKSTSEPYTGIPEGIYAYSIETIDGKQYLNINQQEHGGLTSSNSSMTIDGNDLSVGQGADGFIYEFEK